MPSEHMPSESQQGQKKRHAQDSPPLGTIQGSAKSRKQDSRAPHVAEVRAIPEGERISFGELIKTDSWTNIKKATSTSREDLKGPIYDFARFVARTARTRPEDTLEVLERFIPVWNRREEFSGKMESYIIGTYSILQSRKLNNSASGLTDSQVAKRERLQSIGKIFNEIGPDDYVNFEQLKEHCWKDAETVDSLTRDELCNIIDTYVRYTAKTNRNPPDQTSEAYANWEVLWAKIGKSGAVDETHFTKAFAVNHRLKERYDKFIRRSMSTKDVDTRQSSLTEGLFEVDASLPAFTYNELQGRDWWKKIDGKDEERITKPEYEQAIDDLTRYAFVPAGRNRNREEKAERLRVAQDVRDHLEALARRGSSLGLDYSVEQRQKRLQAKMYNRCSAMLATAAKSRVRQPDLAKLKEGALESDEFDGDPRNLSKEQLLGVLKYYIKLATGPTVGENSKTGAGAESLPDATLALKRLYVYMAHAKAKGWLDGDGLFNDALILARDAIASRRNYQRVRLKRQAREGNSGAEGEKERGTKGKGNGRARGKGNGGDKENRVVESPLDALEECAANMESRDPMDILALVNAAHAFLEKNSFFDFGLTTEKLKGGIEMMGEKLKGVEKIRDHAEAMISRSESSDILTPWERILADSNTTLVSLQGLISGADAYLEFIVASGLED